MCIGMPAKITNLNGDNAKVDVMGLETEVNIGLIENPKMGDYILVHGGCGIVKIDTQYFEELRNIFSSILEVDEYE